MLSELFWLVLLKSNFEESKLFLVSEIALLLICLSSIVFILSNWFSIFVLLSKFIFFGVNVLFLNFALFWYLAFELILVSSLPLLFPSILSSSLPSVNKFLTLFIFNSSSSSIIPLFSFNVISLSSIILFLFSLFILVSFILLFSL